MEVRKSAPTVAAVVCEEALLFGFLASALPHLHSLGALRHDSSDPCDLWPRFSRYDVVDQCGRQLYDGVPVFGRRIASKPMERDSKRIARQWNREIEAEIRRLAARQDDGKWKIVVWTLLEALWLVGLVLMLGLLTRLYW